jgi:hypothetical protein
MWKNIANAPKDGTVVILPVAFKNGVRAYWDGELKLWVLCQPIHIESIRQPRGWKPETGTWAR